MDNNKPVNVGTFIVPQLQKKYKCSKSTAKELVKEMSLPSINDEFQLGNFLYKVVYTRTDPYRFTAEPVAIKEKEVAKEGIWTRVKNSITKSLNHSKKK